MDEAQYFPQILVFKLGLSIKKGSVSLGSEYNTFISLLQDITKC